LILFYIVRGGVNLFYNYLLARFAFSQYHILAYRLFENYLGME
jgi:ATP-binding cassette subfamily B protein